MKILLRLLSFLFVALLFCCCEKGATDSRRDYPYGDYFWFRQAPESRPDYNPQGDRVENIVDTLLPPINPFAPKRSEEQE